MVNLENENMWHAIFFLLIGSISMKSLINFATMRVYGFQWFVKFIYYIQML